MDLLLLLGSSTWLDTTHILRVYVAHATCGTDNVSLCTATMTTTMKNLRSRCKRSQARACIYVCVIVHVCLCTSGCEGRRGETLNMVKAVSPLLGPRRGLKRPITRIAVKRALIMVVTMMTISLMMIPCRQAGPLSFGPQPDYPSLSFLLPLSSFCDHHILWSINLTLTMSHPPFSFYSSMLSVFPSFFFSFWFFLLILSYFFFLSFLPSFLPSF